MAIKYCTECGHPHDEQAKFCPNCGASLSGPAPSEPHVVYKTVQSSTDYQRIVSVIERDKWTAFFLCLLLGWLGAHRFYERRYFTGIIWLLSFGCFGIGWVCDLIFLLGKPNPYYVER